MLVRYVDGTEVTVAPEVWPWLRADGVDYVDIGGHWLQGFTLYWLYPDGDGWVAGGYGPDPPLELTFGRSDGVIELRRPDGVRDLAHAQVKLGWWLPEGGER